MRNNARVFQAILRPSVCLFTGGLLGLLSFAVSSLASAEENSEPLWSFAWVSDMHMGQATPEYIAKSFQYIDEELKPHFVLINGDNNFIEAPADPSDPKETKGLRRQRYLKTFLEKNLKAPYVIIPGDDWPQEFDRVFGPKQYSFDFGGIHFLMLAPDRIYHGNRHEGLSVFDPPTMKWIEKDLDRNREQPILAVIHEPIHPPTFLDAPRLRNIFDDHKNIVATLQGHLHIELAFRPNGTTYLVTPSLGMPPSKAMKLVEVHPNRLILRTFAYNQTDDRFERKEGCQEIAIPESLRDKLSAPPGGKFAKSNLSAVPAHPLIEDPSLESRSGELMNNAVRAIFLGK